MRMKKSQLKEAVKAVVRQCLNERLAKEGCGGGKKRFTGKAGRMFKHVEDSEKEQGKSTKVAKKIAGATVNKKLKEQVGADVVADEGMGNDAAQTPMDDIIKHVIKKVPAIAGNPQKVARVSSLLFQHQFGGQQPPDQETLLGLVQKHMSAGHAPEGQEECGGMEEAGLTSETGGEGYDEQEEIMLIKVMALIAKKLEAMHAGMPGSGPTDGPEAVTVGGEEGGEEEPSEEPSAPPFGGEEEPSEPEHEEEPEEKPEPEEPAEPEDDEKEEKPVNESTKTLPPNKGSYKVVAPRAVTDEEENKALNIQTDPEVNEETEMKMGPQYKTQSPRQARVQKDDHARRIQFDPKMTEAQKKVKENHRVQTRSHVTVKDNPNDPNVMRDPENPQSNGA